MKKILAATLLTTAMTLTAWSVEAQEAPGKPVHGRVALDVIAAIASMQSPSLSPDGKKIVYALGAGNQQVFAVSDLTDSKSKPQVIATAGSFKDSGDRDVVSWRWIGNEHVVLTLQSMENIYGQRLELRRLVSYNLNTGKLTPLAWDGAAGQASDILYQDDKTGTFLLQRQSNKYGSERWFVPEVVKVDVSDGSYSTVIRPNPIVQSWYADHSGVVRMGTGYDGDTGKNRVLYRSDESENFHTVFNEADETFAGGPPTPYIFIEGADTAIVVSNAEGRAKVYKANMETMELGEEVFAVDRYDVNGVVADRRTGDLMGYAYTDDRSRINWENSDFAQIQSFLDESFGASNAKIISTSEDKTKLLVNVSQPSQPGSYYLYDVASGDFALIGYGNQALKDGKLNPVRATDYTASDGKKIQAIITTPRFRQDVKNLPAVMLVHGGPFGVRDSVGYDYWAQALAEAGYVVIQPNYRGSGGYGAKFVTDGRNNGFGLRMQDDLNDAVSYFSQQGLIDSDRICIMGWSYGGFAAARGAQRDPGLWKCAIAGAGVYDLPRMKAYDQRYLGSFGAGYLSKAASELDVVSPARNTDSDWAPILIMHGVRDPRVPIEQARILRSNLKGSGKQEGTDFKYVEQEKNGHYGAYFTFEERMEWLGDATDWLDKHNPAYVPSDPDKAPTIIALK